MPQGNCAMERCKIGSMVADSTSAAGCCTISDRSDSGFPMSVTAGGTNFATLRCKIAEECALNGFKN